MAITTVTGPASEPVTLTEAKAQLRKDGTDEDDYITALIVAARTSVETFLRARLITQTVKLTLDSFPAEIILPTGPVQSVTSITYTDQDGASQTLATSVYQADVTSDPARIREAYLQTWPETRDEMNAVAVTYVVGYGAASDVPADIAHAVKMMVAHLFENRETVADAPLREVPLAYRALLMPHVRFT